MLRKMLIVAATAVGLFVLAFSVAAFVRYFPILAIILSLGYCLPVMAWNVAFGIGWLDDQRDQY